MQKLNTTDYKVMEKIMKNSKISRTDLSKYLELTPAAISKIIKKLLSYNLIVEKLQKDNRSQSGSRIYKHC